MFVLAGVTWSRTNFEASVADDGTGSLRNVRPGIAMAADATPKPSAKTMLCRNFIRIPPAKVGKG